MENIDLFLAHYGYFAIFGLLMLGIVGPLIPDETILVLSGIAVHRGELLLGTTIAVGFAGSLCGITLSYALGRTGAIYALERFEPLQRWVGRHLPQVELWFQRYGKWTLFFGYFIAGVRHFTALAAGISKVRLRTFMLFAYPGGFVWVVCFVSIGYYLGAEWERLARRFNRGQSLAGTSYQVTHDPQLFEPADAASRDIGPELAELTELISGDAAQGPLLAQLTDLTQQREKETQEQRDRVMQGDVAGVQAAIAGGAARRIMEAIRQVVSKMLDEQERVLDIHREATRRAHSEVAAAIWGAALVAILLLIALTQVMVRDSRRLRRVQEELATTLRSVGDAVIATDDAGAVRFINTVAEQLTGWSSIEARGLPLERVFNIFNEESGASVESPVARVLREDTVVGLANHTVLRSRDGKERPIEDSGAPIRGVDGEIRGVVLVFRDATEERAARQALIQSRDALREADRRKDVFLATLSHELRNPLAPIRTATRVLETPNLTQQELERSRSIISRQVRHMAALLDDLLDISRITRGALTLKAEIVDLHGVIEAAIETAQPAISAKRHVLNVEWPQQVIRLSADPVRLTQVVANLLTNAAKYTKPGGLITLGAAQESDQVRIFVRDNGIGIAPDLLPKVFEMFSQVDAGQAHSEGGIGIGLALVKGFVELHGGSVEAKSDGLDGGSEFIVTLPGGKAGSGTDVQVAGAASLDATKAARRRVLIADDNRDGAEIMAMLLDQFGYDVQLAFTGPDAVVAAEKYRPDVAILDIGMPGMNGYEVAQRIRAAPWGESIMLIAVTGWGQDEDKRKAHEAGFNQHLIKPVDPNVLESLMAAAATSVAP